MFLVQEKGDIDLAIQLYQAAIKVVILTVHLSNRLLPLYLSICFPVLCLFYLRYSIPNIFYFKM